MCGVTTGGSENCEWDCIPLGGGFYSNPECLLDCFPEGHCVKKLLSFIFISRPRVARAGTNKLKCQKNLPTARTLRSEMYNNNEILVRTEWVCEDDLCSLVVKNNNRDQSSCSKMLNSIL